MLLLQTDKSSSQGSYPQKFGTTHRESAKLADEIPIEDGLVNTENSLISSGEMVLMQTAKAEIKSTNNGYRHNIGLLLWQSEDLHNGISGKETGLENGKYR